MRLIDGRKVASNLNDNTQKRVAALKKQGHKPGLAVVIVGDNQASQRYVRMKEKKANQLGIASFRKELPEEASEAELLRVINQFNQDSNVNGILVQFPLPRQINFHRVINAISAKKDVDGLKPENIGKLFLNLPEKYPVACTPLGIMKLLKHYEINLVGKNAVVIGRSAIVGRPMLALLLNQNATVVATHSYTKNLKELTRKADIVVSAAGQLRLLSDDDFKKGAVVIDAGQNLDENGHLTGDINYSSESENIALITPTPGGVGPMTIATLMAQTVDLCEWSLDGFK